MGRRPQAVWRMALCGKPLRHCHGLGVLQQVALRSSMVLRLSSAPLCERTDKEAARTIALAAAAAPLSSSTHMIVCPSHFVFVWQCSRWFARSCFGFANAYGVSLGTCIAQAACFELRSLDAHLRTCSSRPGARYLALRLLEF